MNEEDIRQLARKWAEENGLSGPADGNLIRAFIAGFATCMKRSGKKSS